MDKPVWILMKQDMMGWQWHHLDHMKIICTSLQTDNHASSLITQFFYRLDALPNNSVKAPLNAIINESASLSTIMQQQFISLH